jgi:F-type H+-transporting ATPase subunit b
MRGWMRRSCLALLVCGLIAWTGSSVGAEESPKPETKKYDALIHRPGEKEEIERTFDLNEERSFHELMDLLSKGEVEELKRETEVNILAISWDLGLWTVVVFVLLLLVLRKLAWKPMLEGLHRREATIREAREDAQRARDEAERIRAELQKQMSGAEDKVRQILEEARHNAQQTTENMIGQARAEIQSERERLQREIGMARDQALQQIWNQTANLATQISAKLLRRQLTPDDNRRLVDEALAEIGQADVSWKDQLAL